jgi:hypothetical protein
MILGGSYVASFATLAAFLGALRGQELLICLLREESKPLTAKLAKESR